MPLATYTLDAQPVLEWDPTVDLTVYLHVPPGCDPEIPARMQDQLESMGYVETDDWISPEGITVAFEKGSDEQDN